MNEMMQSEDSLFVWVQMNTDFIGFDKFMCFFRVCDTHVYRYTGVGIFKIFRAETFDGTGNLEILLIH